VYGPQTVGGGDRWRGIKNISGGERKRSKGKSLLRANPYHLALRATQKKRRPINIGKTCKKSLASRISYRTGNEGDKGYFWPFMGVETNSDWTQTEKGERGEDTRRGQGDKCHGRKTWHGPRRGGALGSESRTRQRKEHGTSGGCPGRTRSLKLTTGLRAKRGGLDLP